MITFVLFDFDNTLIDSFHLKGLRDARRWSAVYADIKTVRLFEGIEAMWKELLAAKVYVGIVTHSPRPYAERVLEHVGLRPDSLIAYHDLSGKKKPSPYGYQRCCRGRAADAGMAVGDEENDLVAADSFGCTGVFAGWSRSPALSAEACKKSGWLFARHPREIGRIIRDHSSEETE